MTSSNVELSPGVSVSRETITKLEIYHALLLRWQPRINLISRHTETNIWARHIADSAQIITHAPHAKIWADLGSGAGFPGIIISLQLAGMIGGLVHLIDSDKKKCSFLREVVRATGAKALVHCGRIEDIAPTIAVDAVTSRALAPLRNLIDYAEPMLSSGAIGVFPRGQDYQNELTACDAYHKYEIKMRVSRLEQDAAIAVVSIRR